MYILYEYGVVWRVVWLNRKHSDYPDPSYMGESIGHYEGGEFLQGLKPPPLCERVMSDLKVRP